MTDKYTKNCDRGTALERSNETATVQFKLVSLDCNLALNSDAAQNYK